MACAVKTDPISQLEEDLECSVCLEVLKDPRTLPCCHSFCKDCLEGVVQTCRATAPHGRPIQEIPCPNCRAMFPLDPDKHVADMPRNHFICNLVKVTAVLDRGIGVPCSHNCSQSYSVARCVTCEKFLCRECLTEHNNYRANNGHSVLTMEELSKPENRKKIKDKMYCNEHSGKKLKVYCETCDQLICKDCMDFKHVKQEGHSCFLVKDVANNYKILLASNNKAMEDALTEGHVFTERLSLTTKQLDRDAQNAKMQMAKRKESIAKRVLKLLNEKAECLSKKVDEIHDGKRANLDRQTEETNQFVENIKTSVELSKKLVDQGTEEEIVSSQKMMLDNANNLLAKREEYFKAPIPVAKLGYTAHEKEPINQEILRGLTATLGEVNEDPGRIGKTLKIGREEGLWSSIGGEEKTHQSGRNIKPDESFSISPLFLRYIIAYHYEEYQKLENVSQEISFEVSESMADRNLKMFARKDVDHDTFSKTVDKFFDFYQSQNRKMLQELIPKKNWDLILEARAKFTVVIDSARDRNKMVIYGEKENVQKALKFLESKVADSTASTASSSSTLNDAGSGSSSRGTNSGRLPNPKDGTGKKVTVEKLSCVLFSNLKVSVYQADLTKETADVIVNPTNERLKHDGGAAEAIVKAGGKIIQDESDEIMKRRNRPLSPGEVVPTHSGNLPCNFIIHAVGPRWFDYRYHEKDTAKKVLYSAVLNCLMCASHYAATSISIPAICSGIFGVPVNICAEVLFSAATDFAKNAPKSNSLKEIRFVNIDKTTTQVFVQEMKKRFGASIKQESVEIHHSKSDKANNPADQQHRLIGAWRENPMTLASYTEGHSSSGNDNKGSGVGSNLNANALPFNENRFSEKPPSYSDVSRKRTKEPDKPPAPDTVDDKKEECSICLCDMTDKKTLHKCGHSFCAGCIDRTFKHNKKCPICSTVYGALKGNQPKGNMYSSFRSTSLPGFGSCGTITISYRFPSGTQGPEHPHPGKPYTGTDRNAYLPDNKEGNKVLRLLKKAFEQKLTFTIGRSVTTGRDDCVVWNDIHHKTATTGGPTNFGYPDPTYLKRVQEELAAKGITE